MKRSLKQIMGKTVFTILFIVPLIAVVQIPIFLAGAVLGAYLAYSKELPQIPAMDHYQPRTVSTFYADDGTVIGIFYQEKRFVVELEQMPPHVIKAFLGAEDSRFYQHNGIDWQSMARAALATAKAGRFAQGGSTITMQVTRNFLLSRDKTLGRKIKEIFLAPRLERMWGKKKILYVYLNEIYLGDGNYGVEAAARGYFDKPVEHLTLAEAALISGLIASPGNYNPFKSEKLARQRQLTVLGRMVKAGLITEAEYQQAVNQPLVYRKEQVRPFNVVPDFAEAVRRYIVKKYGAERLLYEGIKVFTTCRVEMQKKAQEALEKGVKEVEARQKHLAILNDTLSPEDVDDLLERRRTPQLVDGKIYQGVVRKVIKDKKTGRIDLQVALSKSLKGLLRVDKSAAGVYKPGYLLALRFDGFAEDTPVFSLDDKPQLQGALVCIENRTGYVRALVGGATTEQHGFNRAIQAKRQPGSAFKPIVYAVALEQKSYSPATVVVDEAIKIDVEEKQGEQEDPNEPEDTIRPGDWVPRNAGGKNLGPMSFRRALEQSRNICTIKILIDVGFGPVVEMARRMGITEPLGHNYSLSLGTSELSLYELTGAYTVFPNSGVYVEPVLVKRIEDRHGNVLEDNSEIAVLEESEIPVPQPRKDLDNFVLNPPYALPDDEGQRSVRPHGRTRGTTDALEESRQRPNAAALNQGVDSQQGDGLKSHRVRPAMSPQTAYIITSILQGALVRGTGAGVRKFLQRRDMAGKTGTTNRSADTWFIGFSPDYTAGVWVGFDEKRPLGHKEAGGRAALPVWGYFMKDVLAKVPEKEFPIPPDMIFEQLVTVGGNDKEGFVRQQVTEPVYAPFNHRTIFTSLLDPPQMLDEKYLHTVPQYLQGVPQEMVQPQPHAGYANPNPNPNVSPSPGFNPYDPHPPEYSQGSTYQPVQPGAGVPGYPPAGQRVPPQAAQPTRQGAYGPAPSQGQAHVPPPSRAQSQAPVPGATYGLPPAQQPRLPLFPAAPAQQHRSQQTQGANPRTSPNRAWNPQGAQ